MTTVFHAPPTAFTTPPDGAPGEIGIGSHVVLPDTEARHATRVLRLREGAEIVVVDGAGGWHRVRLVHTEIGRAIGDVVASERPPPPAPLRLALAVLKSDERFETAIEKATELGVTDIVPVISSRVEAGARFRGERARAVLVAAMKQSLRAHLPHLHAPAPLATVVGPRAVVLHEGAPLADTLARMLAAPVSDDAAPLTLVVGPEGGFTDAELAAAVAAGASVASLGAARLRAETAAIVAVALATVRG